MQQVVMRLLSDGSGRVCIHWLYEHPEGPLETTDNSIMTATGPKVLKGRKWRMACNPNLKAISSVQDGARIIPWTHTDDPRAATCPKCLATEEYKQRMKELEEVVESLQPQAKGA